MRRNNSQNSPHNRQRSGFTLIELLVAMGILTLLGAIAFLAMRPTGKAARITATRATIQKVMSMLTQYKEDVARGDGDPVALRQTTARANDASIVIPGEVAIAFARKAQLKKNVPQRIEDVFARLAGLDAQSGSAPSYDRLASEKDAVSLKAESAELLYAFLTGGKVKILEGGTERSVEIGNVSLGTENSSSSLLKANEIGDTDGDGQMEIIDAWGEPLRFYRWPTRLIRPDTDGDGSAEFGSTPNDLVTGTNPNNILTTVMSNVPEGSVLAKDPDDPLDDLSRYDRVLGRGGRNRNSYDDLNEANYHTPNTYHTFLLVSAGPDNELGLEEPSGIDPDGTNNWGYLAQPLSSVLADPLNSELNDNLTNLQEDLSK